MPDVNNPELKWEVGWDGHERAQLMRMANLPLSQKLLWLEEAEELVAHLHSQRKNLPKQSGAEVTKRESNHE